jgi:hypothetical protein
LVERRIPNALVVGSSPAILALYGPKACNFILTLTFSFAKEKAKEAKKGKD